MLEIKNMNIKPSNESIIIFGASDSEDTQDLNELTQNKNIKYF